MIDRGLHYTALALLVAAAVGAEINLSATAQSENYPLRLVLPAAESTGEPGRDDRDLSSGEIPGQPDESKNRPIPSNFLSGIAPQFPADRSTLSTPSGPSPIVSNFRLPPGLGDSDGLRVDKSLFVDGKAYGRVPLTIRQGNRISISTSRVHESVPELAAILDAQDDMVEFETLRASGLKITYDASRDRVVIETGVSPNL